MKKIITIMLLVMLVGIAVPTTQAKAQTTHYRSMVVKVDKVKKEKTQYDAVVYWKGRRVAKYTFQRKPLVRFVTPNHLTYQMLSTREGRVLYIEILNGIVLDDEGNGKVTNGDPVYNYISYWRTPYCKGDKVRTYCVYTPYNNAEDDIHLRFDEKRR